jgi:hypothetical protein
MTVQREVFRLHQSTDLKYPRFDASHRRNSGVDFAALGRYADHGKPSDSTQFALFMNARRNFDTVWIGGIRGPIASTRLRATLEDVAGDCFDALPVVVNEEPFWIVRVHKVLDALDPLRSGVRYDIEGVILDIDAPFWLGERIRDPILFTIPNLPTQIWATESVAQAYNKSGCND